MAPLKSSSRIGKIGGGKREPSEVCKYLYIHLDGGYVGVYLCQSSSICTVKFCVLTEYKKYPPKEVFFKEVNKKKMFTRNFNAMQKRLV